MKSRAEILTWEWFFLSIGAIRAGILEEMREPIRKGENEEREE